MMSVNVNVNFNDVNLQSMSMSTNVKNKSGTVVMSCASQANVILLKFFWQMPASTVESQKWPCIRPAGLASPTASLLINFWVVVSSFWDELRNLLQLGWLIGVFLVLEVWLVVMAVPKTNGLKCWNRLWSTWNRSNPLASFWRMYHQSETKNTVSRLKQLIW